MRYSSLWRKGFTLVELLVVVAIISLLITVLLPSLKKARDAAKSVVCLGNLSQLGTMCHIYGIDNKSVIPYAQDSKLNVHGVGYGNPWYFTDKTYRGWMYDFIGDTTSKKRGVIICPAADPWDVKPINKAFSNYAANYMLFRFSLYEKPYRSISSMTHPARAMFIIDVAYTGVNQDNWPIRFTIGPGATEYGRQDFRHNNAANTLYGDGHALFDKQIPSSNSKDLYWSGHY